MAILTARRGRISEAARPFLQFTPLTDRANLAEIDVYHWVREAAEVLVQANETAAAQDLVDRIMRLLASSDLNRHGPHGAALRVTALLAARSGDAQRAEEAFRQAAIMHALSNEDLEHGRTLLAYGSRMRRVCRAKEARSVLRQAEEIFEHCGSGYWQRKAEAEYTLAKGRRRKAEHGHLSRLTPQEHRVTELVTQGFTNRQIAAVLLISPKTVETHLRHVYDKMQTGSREELKLAFMARVNGSRTLPPDDGTESTNSG